MKWARVFTILFLVCFGFGCSVHVGPHDSTHHSHHKKKKGKSKKKAKKKTAKKKKAETASNENAANDPPADDSGSDKKLLVQLGVHVPEWVTESEGKSTGTKPSKNNSAPPDDDMKKDIASGQRTAGQVEAAKLSAGQTAEQTVTLTDGSCSTWVVQGDAGVKDIAAVLTEGKGKNIKVVAQDDPKGNRAVLNRGRCIPMTKKTTVTLHILIEKGNGEIFVQRFRN
jgi:hypothetical protein